MFTNKSNKAAVMAVTIETKMNIIDILCLFFFSLSTSGIFIVVKCKAIVLKTVEQY